MQVGSPRQIYEDPQTSAVASRLGSPRINLVARSALGAWPAPRDAVTVGVRAEHLHVHAASADALPALRATVRRIEILSDQRLVHLALAGSGAELISAAPARGSVEPGSEVGVELDAAALVRRRRPPRRRLSRPTNASPEPAPWTTCR